MLLVHTKSHVSILLLHKDNWTCPRPLGGRLDNFILDHLLHYLINLLPKGKWHPPRSLSDGRVIPSVYGMCHKAGCA